MPSQYGFSRIVTLSERGSTLDELGNVVEGKQRIDIYYSPPVGRKLRSSKEVEKYLSKHPQSLSLRNFSFKQKKLGLGEFETVRQANSRKKEAVSTKPLPTPPSPEIRTEEPSDSKIRLHIHCEELGKETTIRVKRGRLLKNTMRKFNEVAAGYLQGPKQFVFLCAGKRLKESDSVDSLQTNKIDVQLELAERGN